MRTYTADLKPGQVHQHTAKQWEQLAKELEAAYAEYPLETFAASIKLCHAKAMLADIRRLKDNKLQKLKENIK